MPRKSSGGAGNAATGVTIARLADHPGAVPVLAAAFLAEWSEHYGDRTAESIAEDFRPGLRTDGIPMALVALRGDEAVGTAALRPDSITTHPHLSPWMAAFWVRADLRNLGVGRRLILAIEEEARRLGFRKLYAGSGRAAPLFLRAGFRVSARVEYHGADIAILVKELGS